MTYDDFINLSIIATPVIIFVVNILLTIERKTGISTYKSYSRNASRKWCPWYAWFPVFDVRGNIQWCTTIYRTVGNTYVDQEDWTWYYYGTVFDVLATK